MKRIAFDPVKPANSSQALASFFGVPAGQDDAARPRPWMIMQASGGVATNKAVQIEVHA